jgi:hypothetical protein
MEAEIQPQRYSHYKVPLFWTDGHKTYTLCRLCQEMKGVRFQENLYDTSREGKVFSKIVPLIRDKSDTKFHR